MPSRLSTVSCAQGNHFLSCGERDTCAPRHPAQDCITWFIVALRGNGHCHTLSSFSAFPYHFCPRKDATGNVRRKQGEYNLMLSFQTNVYIIL